MKGQADPRLLVRLFPELRGDLISRDEEIEVFGGLESQVREAQNVDDISECRPFGMALGLRS
jgi:vacuolar protein sorting-associated protein 3